MEKRFTFNALVSCFALRAGLITLSSFIFIARSAHRECTFIASNKWLAVICYLNLIPTDLANLTTQFFNRCYLQFILARVRFISKLKKLENFSYNKFNYH